MSRINDQLYVTIGTDNHGVAVMTVYRVVSGGHIIMNELHGKDATKAYSFIMKTRSDPLKEAFKFETK